MKRCISSSRRITTAFFAGTVLAISGRVWVKDGTRAHGGELHEDPGVAALSNSGASDFEYGVRSIHTSNTNGVCSGCGGVAYVGSFDAATRSTTAASPDGVRLIVSA